MRRALRDREEGISQVAAMSVFLLLAVVISGCAYAFVRSVEPPSGSAFAVSFAHGSYGEEPTGISKTLTVTVASLNTYWWYLEVQLDGARLPCSETHEGADSWRLWWQGRIIPCDGPRHMPDELVGAGEWIEIWDADAGPDAPLAGRTLQIVDVDHNAIVQRLSV